MKKADLKKHQSG